MKRDPALNQQDSKRSLTLMPTMSRSEPRWSSRWLSRWDCDKNLPGPSKTPISRMPKRSLPLLPPFMEASYPPIMLKSRQLPKLRKSNSHLLWTSRKSKTRRRGKIALLLMGLRAAALLSRLFICSWWREIRQLRDKMTYRKCQSIRLSPWTSSRTYKTSSLAGNPSSKCSPSIMRGLMSTIREAS
jgi:hypothetical protein